MAAIAEAVDQPASAQTGSVVLSGLSVDLGPEGRQTVDDKMSQLRALGETPVVVVLADRCDQLTALSAVGRAGRSRWSPPSGLAPFSPRSHDEEIGHRRGTDQPVAVQVLVENGLERFQRIARSRQAPTRFVM